LDESDLNNKVDQLSQRTHYMFGQFWPKVEDDIRQTLYRSLMPSAIRTVDIIGFQSY